MQNFTGNSMALLDFWYLEYPLRNTEKTRKVEPKSHKIVNYGLEVRDVQKLIADSWSPCENTPGTLFSGDFIELGRFFDKPLFIKPQRHFWATVPQPGALRDTGHWTRDTGHGGHFFKLWFFITFLLFGLFSWKFGWKCKIARGIQWRCQIFDILSARGEKRKKRGKGVVPQAKVTQITQRFALRAINCV